MMSKHAASEAKTTRSVGTTEHKTVTFGDPSTVRGSPFWMILSIVILAILWFCVSFFEWIDPSFGLAPMALWNRFVEVAQEGYRNITLMEHLTASLFRIFAGVTIGSIVGISLGIAMGLSSAFRGFFDPIVEFLRFIPAIALIPLIGLWIPPGELVKILIISLAVVWIMTIAARSGVLSTKLSKVHSAYSLGASKTQLLRHVILPSALPEIVSGLRFALRICWEPLIMIELLSAGEGIGAMIWIASKFFKLDIIIIGIIMIGLTGLIIDLIMRRLEARLTPWRGI